MAAFTVKVSGLETFIWSGARLSQFADRNKLDASDKSTKERFASAQAQFAQAVSAQARASDAVLVKGTVKAVLNRKDKCVDILTSETRKQRANVDCEIHIEAISVMHAKQEERHRKAMAQTKAILDAAKAKHAAEAEKRKAAEAEVAKMSDAEKAAALEASKLAANLKRQAAIEARKAAKAQAAKEGLALADKAKAALDKTTAPVNA